VFAAASARSGGTSRLATDLTGVGRAACDPALGRSRVDVPLVSLSWLCFPSGAKIAGSVPGVTRPLWFSAATLRPSPDLQAITLDDVHVAGRFGGRDFRADVRKLRLKGLPRWASASRLAGFRRGAIVAAAALATSLAAAWGILRRPDPAPISAALAAGFAASVMLASLRFLDGRAWPLLTYAVVPLAGVAAILGGISLVFRVRARRVAWGRGE
jgi:hypothetical protein